MNQRRKIAILSSLVSVAGLAFAGSAFAASWHWDMDWGSTAGFGVAATCSAPVSAIGNSAINGNDRGQVVAFCTDNTNHIISCGDVHGTPVGVRGRGRPSGGQWEYTGASTGQSAYSPAYGSAHVEHQCQMGYYY